nr:hypothetical protein [Tanacetum cinerariifolium]
VEHKLVDRLPHLDNGGEVGEARGDGRVGVVELQHHVLVVRHVEAGAPARDSRLYRVEQQVFGSARVHISRYQQAVAKEAKVKAGIIASGLLPAQVGVGEVGGHVALVGQLRGRLHAVVLPGGFGRCTHDGVDRVVAKLLGITQHALGQVVGAVLLGARGRAQRARVSGRGPVARGVGGRKRVVEVIQIVYAAQQLQLQALGQVNVQPQVSVDAEAGRSVLGALHHGHRADVAPRPGVGRVRAVEAVVEVSGAARHAQRVLLHRGRPEKLFLPVGIGQAVGTVLPLGVVHVVDVGVAQRGFQLAGAEILGIAGFVRLVDGGRFAQRHPGIVD